MKYKTEINKINPNLRINLIKKFFIRKFSFSGFYSYFYGPEK